VTARALGSFGLDVQDTIMGATNALTGGTTQSWKEQNDPGLARQRAAERAAPGPTWGEGSFDAMGNYTGY
jgi:hypothetical protein